VQITDLVLGIGFFIGGIIISLICNRLLLTFSQTLGIRNKNDVIVRWSNQSKPSLGGVSFYIVYIFSIFAFSVVFFEESIFQNSVFTGCFLSGSLAFLMGLADDAYNTKPLLKLLAQISCGITFVLFDIQIDLFHSYWPDAIITVVWVVTLMNSLNMLDNMDGITGTTVLFVFLSCLAAYFICFPDAISFWSLSLLSLIGGLLGFLYFNIHPSKLFMGDAGSQFVGLMVAFFTIHFNWNLSAKFQVDSWAGMILALIALTPAAADTLTVVINRLKQGKSPMVGGKDHTTHHLVYSGYTDKQVWIVFLILGMLSFLISVLIIFLIKNGSVSYIPLFVIYFLVVFIYLYRKTILFPQPKNK
jgi:UDP-GlcNAc:undecaprenyl-phosphate GlcNAc-1-phosphate transferase